MPGTKSMPKYIDKLEYIQEIRKALNEERDKLNHTKARFEALQKKEEENSKKREEENSNDVTKGENEEQPVTDDGQNDGSSDHDSEYKIRYESQAELNRHLLREIETLKKRLDQEKKSMKKGNLSITDESEYYGAKGKKLLIRLQREKLNLHSLIRDYEWKLDQEAKTYHKVNERCAQMIRDIQRAGAGGAVSGNTSNISSQASTPASKGSSKKRRESKVLPGIQEVSGGRRKSLARPNVKKQ